MLTMLQAMSPDGQTIVTGAGDETLRFWNVFNKTRSHKVVHNGLILFCYNYFYRSLILLLT